jgi:hypothetical protein
MAVFIEMDLPVTPDQYDEVHAALDTEGNPPDGLIAHTARIEDGTLKVLDVWESPEAFGAFAESRLGPTIGDTLGDDAPAERPEPKVTQLHNAHGV